MGVFNKVFFSILSISLINISAFALDNEFKNTLTKIDLIKTGENSYNINLQAKNNFAQPVKVIKKSDLNYYILLPETKNSISTTSTNGSDIRNISADLYPYAGQDINNGYTKININTTKPINFNVSINNNSQTATKENSPIALAKQESVNNSSEAKIQKKNSDFQESSKILNKTKSVTKTATKTFKEKIIPAKKQVAQNNTQKAVKIEDLIKEEVQKAKQERRLAILESLEPNPDSKPMAAASIQEEALLSEDITELEKLSQNESSKSISNSKISSIKNKLNEYGISLKELFAMLLATLISFIVIITLLTRKKPQTRLKNKNDLIEKSEKETLVPKKEASEEKPKNDGKYFVFENNIKQTGFCDPSTSAIKKNYELSSYDPELTHDYNKFENQIITRKSYSDNKENDYEIIQKILKEDSFIEIAPGEYEVVSKVQTVKTAPLKEEPKIIKENPKQQVSTPIKKEEPQPQTQTEPEVISSIEIAPQKGFMCVSYNDNINLLGYIFDDVFALYNFKQTKLENYDIKYRLSEKDDKGAMFIVKVDSTKMLIRVTKSAMNLEVIL